MERSRSHRSPEARSGLLQPVNRPQRPSSMRRAWRVAMAALAALALFAVVVVRLSDLQLRSGDKYLAQAHSNRVRVVREPAPRGPIIDRHGRALVQNRRATAVRITPRSLPAAERAAAAEWGQANARRARALAHRGKHRAAKRVRPVRMPPIATDELARRLRRLGRVLGMRATTIHHRIIRQLAQMPYAPVTVKSGVSRAVRTYLSERRDQFPGVELADVWLRRYPHGELAAQLLGTVGEVSPRQLKRGPYRGVAPGTVVGQEGLEYTYDRYLRGRDGEVRYVVDAFGRDRGTAGRRPPVSGMRLRLSLDVELQRVGQDAIQRAGGGKPGAFVALDPRNGQVLAMGSQPSYKPALLAGPISQRRYERLFGSGAGSPRVNRAIAGQYPTGSTFKPVTALAGLARGVITPETVINDPGCIAVGVGRTACNAGKQANGPVDLRRALQVSSDVYFYTLGLRTDARRKPPIQTWARRLGLGRRTGIDLPGEAAGIVPDRAWRARIAREERRCERRRHVPSCGISDKRPWSVGDNVNLSIGQGDLLATPLQMAVAYAAIANGGKVVRPHVGLRVEDHAGRTLRRIDPPAARRVRLDPAARAAIMDGLHLAASAPGGTSADVFAGWPQDRFPVYGKTGTAQHVGQEDQSWYVAFVRSATRPIVVAVTIERGGFGAETAAPAAREILSQWCLGHPGRLVKGASQSR